jgi:hypothetical protein
VRHDDLRRGHAGLLHFGIVARDVRGQRLLHLRGALVLQQRELQRWSDLLRDSRYRRSPDRRLRRRSLSVLPTLRAPSRMHWGTTVHRHDLSGQPGNLRQVRGSHVQHPSALLPEHGQVLPRGLGILLPLSVEHQVTMRKHVLQAASIGTQPVQVFFLNINTCESTLEDAYRISATLSQTQTHPRGSHVAFT